MYRKLQQKGILGDIIENMPTWLPFLFLNYKYVIIALIAIPEGPILMAICGFLIRIGSLSFWPAFIALIIGDFIADIIWYALGRTGGLKIARSKFGRIMGLNDKNIQLIGRYFHKYHELILFISKLTTGFGFAPVVLFTAGLVKIPFKKYLVLNFIGGFVWTGFLIALGYSFSHFFITISNVSGKITLVGASLLALFVVLKIGRHIHNVIARGNLSKN